MNPLPQPQVSRRPRLPLIWIVPLVALAVAVWMVFREWRQRGPEVQIEFSDGSGMEVGKTTLAYKGVEVGAVTAVDLKPDLGGVVVHVRLERDAAGLARDGSLFWSVRPEIGFTGVSGLDTLVSGVRLAVRPGDGAPATRFRGLDRPPAREEEKEGRAFWLVTDSLGTLLPRAPVLYRGIKVGEVETMRLSADAAAVLVRIRVSTPFVDLVRSGTQFWNAGGAPFSISLFGSHVRTSSIQAFLTGAIAFATPEEPAEPAPEGTRFQLNPEADKEWLKWSPRIPIVVPDQAPEERPPAAPPVPALIKG